MLKRIAVSIVALGLLTACQTTETANFSSAPDFAVVKPATVRVGLTSAQTANLVKPSNGMRVRYSVPSSPSFPFSSVLDFRLSKVAEGYAGKGNMRVELPIENLSEIIAGLKEATGRSPKLDGRNALVPLKFGFDDQMRSSSFEMMGRSSRDVPHDCLMVIGDCESALYESDAGWTYRIFTTFEEGGRFYSVKRLDPSKTRGRGNDLLELSVYSVDKYGLPIDINFYDFEDGPPVFTSIKRKY